MAKTTTTTTDTPPTQSRAGSLLALLDQVQPDDLTEIDTEIASMQARLDSLQSARKLVVKRLGIEEPKPASTKPGRKSPIATRSQSVEGGPTTGTGRTYKENPKDPTAARVLDYIAAKGVRPISKLAVELDISYQTVYSAVSASDWFDRASDGVHLTHSGWAMAKIRQSKDAENGTGTDTDDDMED